MLLLLLGPALRLRMLLPSGRRMGDMGGERGGSRGLEGDMGGCRSRQRPGQLSNDMAYAHIYNTVTK